MEQEQEQNLPVKVNYYNDGFCQLHAKIGRTHIVATDVMRFDESDLPDIKKMNWHGVSDPNGFAEPNFPLNDEKIKLFEWAV